MPRLIVEVFADALQYFTTLERGEKAAASFTAETTQMGASAKLAAEAQVAAALRSTEALRTQLGALREVAVASEQGSAEQVAATRLAERAQEKLAASMGVTAHEARTLGISAAVAERDISRATRGMLAGSGIASGLGRSLAFASGGFLAFAGAAEFIRGSVDATREAVVAERQLDAQMKAAGESFDDNKNRIEEAAKSYAQLGFKASDVVESLTVLERGTGNLNRALSLEQLTADIARARHIDLSKSALLVSKVFGGQETALRRAVPGLSKHAHGLDLIQLAEAKMAGQATASTTAQERFGAQLFNTEEIVGNALLPTLNSLLTTWANWLQKQNESGNLEKKVSTAARDMSAVFSAISGVIGAVDKITGSFVNTLKSMALVWLLIKQRTLLIKWGLIQTEIAATGAAAATAEAEVAAFGGTVGTLAAIGPIAIPIIIAISVTQSPEYLAFRKWAKEHLGPGNILAFNIGDFVKGAVKAGRNVVDLAFGTAPPPETASGARPSDRPEGPFAGFFAAAERAAVRRRNAPAFTPMENRWFDANLARQLDRVQDLSLRNQLARLKQIAEVIQGRINATKDLTRRLSLQDQLVRVLREEKSVREQITGQIKEQTTAIQDQADAIKSAVLSQLDALQTKVQNQRALQEALKQLRVARQIGGPQGIKAARAAVFDARLAAERARVEARTPTIAHGRFSLGDMITINVHGNEDPEVVARKVVAILARRNRHTTTPRRGPAAGSPAGPH